MNTINVSTVSKQRYLFRILSFEILDLECVGKGETSRLIYVNFEYFAFVFVVFHLFWQTFSLSSFYRQLSTAYSGITRMFEFIFSFELPK